MLITPCAWGENAKPTAYSSGRVFTWVHGRQIFVGTYVAATIAEVASQAYINARIAQMRYGLAAKMRVT